jgi:molybdopterin-guanine dinucleotide biosynthesis protein A
MMAALAGAIDVEFDLTAEGGDPFQNLNTPQDLADAEARLARRDAP